MRDEETIFAEALTKQSLQERSAFLDDACAGSADLRSRVEILLAAHEKAGAFLESPPPGITIDRGDAENVTPAPATERPGTIIGPYKLLEQIGEGGMGVVFMAEQLHPVRRRVALKIIKPGLDTRQVIARFEAERQALAMMDHPSIAKVFDAGTTDAAGGGRPYFVMELIKGIPITDYCDQHHLTPRQRLELFVQVCQAVQHAHSKGIIHRDLKPTNVLVTLNDGDKPTPKVIDFGIAKATAGQRLTDRTLFTELRQMIGTPLYMSPEQAEMSAVLDVDTRSDVYSLGVLLYELLTGTTPFDKQRLASAAFDEVRRIIREEEPPRPSTRLSTMLGDTLTTVSASRHTDPKRLGQTVRGELDWIVMRALEKERSRRYETANGFARDIERYLADQPVEACPPSRMYRLKKFARRNKATMTTAAIVLVVLMLATAVSTWQAVRATRAKAAALTDKKRTDRSAAIATSITESLQQMLASANPEYGRGSDYTVRQMLDDFAGQAASKVADQPEVEASLQRTIGMAYFGFGDGEKGTIHLKRALELRRRIFGDQNEKVADTLVDYAWTLKALSLRNNGGQRALAEAEGDLREALAIYQNRGVTGGPVLGALRVLMLVLNNRGRLEESVAVAEQGLTLARQTPGVEYPGETSAFYAELAQAKMRKADFAGAEALYRQALALKLRLVGQDGSGREYGDLANALLAQHKFPEALAAYQQSLSIIRRAYSPDHYKIGQQLNFLSKILKVASDSSALVQTFPSVDKLSEIEALYRPSLTTPMTPLNKLLNRPDLDPPVAAAQGLARLVHVFRQLASELTAAGRMSEAEMADQRATALVNRLCEELAGNPYLQAAAYPDLSSALIDLGRPNDAMQMARKVAELNSTDARLFNEIAWSLAASAHSTHENVALAVEFAEKAVAVSPNDGIIWNTLGIARYRAGDWQKAIEALQKSHELQGDQNFSDDAFFLAMAHWQLGHKDEARRWYDQAVTWMDKNQPKNEELLRFKAEAAALIAAPPAATTLPEGKSGSSTAPTVAPAAAPSSRPQ